MEAGRQVDFTLQESADLVSWSSIGEFAVDPHTILEVDALRFAASVEEGPARLHVWAPSGLPDDRALRICIHGGPIVRLMGPGPPGMGP